MKLAIVGVGRVAKSQMRALELAGGIDLAGAYDIDPDKASLVPERTRFYSSLDNLIEGSDADLILVSTPTDTHYKVAITILNRGKNLLLEKPACEKPDEFADLLAHRKPSQFFSVALHFGYAAEVLWWLHNASSIGLRFGGLKRFEAEFFDPYVMDGRLGEQTASLAGSWLDSGINALSVIGALLGGGELRVGKVFGRSLQKREVETQADLIFQNGEQSIEGVIKTSWLKGVNEKTTKLYYDGDVHVLLDHSKQKIEISENDKVFRAVDLDAKTPALVAHYTNLFKTIRNWPKCDTNLGLAVSLHSTLYAVQSKSNAT